MTFFVFFALALVADLLAVSWHGCRETQRVAAAAAISMGLETLSWLPIWFALTLDDPAVPLACVVGSGVGTAWALRTQKSPAPTEERGPSF